MNCICYAANEGIPLKGTTMYVTHRPCNPCMKHIIPAGIKRIIYMHEYVDPNPQEDMGKFLEFVELIKFSDL